MPISQLSSEVLKTIQEFIGEDLGFVFFLRDDLGMEDVADDVYNVAENYHLAAWESSFEVSFSDVLDDDAIVTEDDDW